MSDDKTIVTVKRGRGRPKGSQNKQTILQEAIRTKSEKLILKEFPKIVKAVIEKAKDGDLVAAKMLMDRIIPVKRAVELTSGDGKEAGITINIENLIKPDEAKRSNEVVDASFEEIKEEDNGKS